MSDGCAVLGSGFVARYIRIDARVTLRHAWLNAACNVNWVNAVVCEKKDEWP